MTEKIQDSASELLPSSLGRWVPFTPEPIARWDESGQLFGFLTELHGPMYTSWSHEVFERGQARVVEMAGRFSERAKEAQPMPGAVVSGIIVPDLLLDAHFGLAAKVLVAWDAVVEDVLADGTFFSIGHVLEAATEFDCSFLLAEHLFYKQALQVLRNFVEVVVLPLHFCSNPTSFEQWKGRDSEYRTPSMRGPRGALKGLARAGVLPDELVDDVGDLYGRLNGAVHSASRHMIHDGTQDGTYLGHVFKYDALCQWAGFAARAVGAGIALLRINFQQWEAVQQPGTRVCVICHGTDFEELTQDDPAFRNLRCTRCGDDVTFSC